MPSAANAIAQKIVDEASGLRAVREGNQPTLYGQVKRLLDEAILDGQLALDFFQEVDGEHGRIETRRVWASDQVQHLTLSEPWRGLGSIACAERVREVIGGGNSTERSDYISSISRPSAARLADTIRGHWGIENQLHWHLDVSFGEHACRIRSGQVAETFSRLRRLALNQLQRERTLKGGIKTKRLKSG